MAPQRRHMISHPPVIFHLQQMAPLLLCICWIIEVFLCPSHTQQGQTYWRRYAQCYKNVDKCSTWIICFFSKDLPLHIIWITTQDCPWYSMQQGDLEPAWIRDGVTVVMDWCPLLHLSPESGINVCLDGFIPGIGQPGWQHRRDLS